MSQSALFARMFVLIALALAPGPVAGAQMMGEEPALPVPGKVDTKPESKPAPSVKPITPEPGPQSPRAVPAQIRELDPFAFRPALERSWAIAGAPIVVPIRPSKPLPAGGPVSVRIGSVTIPARIVFYAPEPGPKGWMDYAANWSVSDRPIDAGGFWAIVATLPPSVPEAQAKLFDEPLNFAWVRPPKEMTLPKLTFAPEPGTLVTTLQQGASSPVEAWRCELVLGVIDKASTPPELAPGLRELRAMTSVRWRAALALLNQADPGVASSVLARLTRVVSFGPGGSVPMWPLPGPELSRLLDDLLDPTLLPRQRADRASAWLASQPRALAWTLDDAGIKGAPGAHQTSTIALLELSGTPGVVSFAPASEQGDNADAPRPSRPSGSAPELTPIGAAGWLRLITPSVPLPEQRWPDPAARVASALAGREVAVSVGRSALSTRTLARPVPVIPPGFEIGPLVQDWSMGTLSAGLPSVEPERTVGKLSYDLTTGTWQLAIEATLATTTSGESDALASDPGVRVYLGPFEKPTHVLHVRPTGQAIDQVTSSVSSVRVVRTPGAGPDKPTRWLAIVPIPDDAIENETIVRLSLTRISPTGVRSSWPRAMLPWQSEPGRLAMDLGAWSGLEP